MFSGLEDCAGIPLHARELWDMMIAAEEGECCDGCLDDVDLVWMAVLRLQWPARDCPNPQALHIW